LKRPPVGEVEKRTCRGRGEVRSGQYYEKGGRGPVHHLHSLARGEAAGKGIGRPETEGTNRRTVGLMKMSRDVGRAGERTVRGTRWKRGPRRASVTVAAVGTLVGGLLGVSGGGAGASVGAHRAASKATTTEYYLALGDSLAAGVGSPDGKGYVTDLYKKASKKSKKEHASLVLENLACSGATTGSMINGPGCDYASGTQLGDAEAFLEAHPGQTAFMTIDIGANDVDGCTSGTTINQTCVTNGLEAISSNLPVILSGLESAGGTTPIVGMSYYDPFLAAWLLGGSGETLAEQSVGLLDDLNGILSSDYGSADTADVTGAFKSSDFSPGGRYEGVKVPVNVGLICHWTLMCSEENIHADDAGHAQIAQAFEKIVTPLLKSEQRRTGRRRRPANSI
jgi:lysophospholipase L1-like esterase